MRFPKGMNMNDSQPILKVDQLSVAFGGIKALQDISFPVARHSITAIIGPNGAGKTTLFNCITGFYKASSGEIYFNDGHQQHQVSSLLAGWFGGSHSIAALGIARTFQNIRLFSEMTAVENLLVAQHNQLHRGLIGGVLALPSYRRSEYQALEKAKKWLDIMGLNEDANRLAGELPYGHQRRLEIARAMCTNSKIICLDEPAAGLNHNETRELSALISLLRREHQMTVLVIEHDMALVMEVSDHIVVLDYGQVICQGPPAAVKANPKVLAAYLGEESL